MRSTVPEHVSETNYFADPGAEEQGPDKHPQMVEHVDHRDDTDEVTEPTSYHEQFPPSQRATTHQVSPGDGENSNATYDGASNGTCAEAGYHTPHREAEGDEGQRRLRGQTGHGTYSSNGPDQQPVQRTERQTLQRCREGVDGCAAGSHRHCKIQHSDSKPWPCP